MTRHGFSTLSIRIGGSLLLIALLAIGVFAPIRPVEAASQRVVAAPIHVAANHTIAVSLTNTTNQPIGVQFRFLDGANMSNVLSSSAAMVLAPGAGSYLTYAPGHSVFVSAALSVSSMAGNDTLNAAVQMFDPSGKTQILIALLLP